MSFFIVYKRGPKADFEAASWPSHMIRNPERFSEAVEMAYGKRFDWYGLHASSREDAISLALESGFSPKRYAPRAL